MYFSAPVAVLAYLGVIGLVIIASLAFERSRYRGARNAKPDLWQATGERFRDPGSGRLMEVRSDPRTGERAYLEVPESSIAAPEHLE